MRDRSTFLCCSRGSDSALLFDSCRHSREAPLGNAFQTRKPLPRAFRNTNKIVVYFGVAFHESPFALMRIFEITVLHGVVDEQLRRIIHLSGFTVDHA